MGYDRSRSPRSGAFFGGWVLAPPPATGAPPTLAARVGGADTARSVKLQKIALRVRARKTTTSFVGLRG